MTAHLLKTNFVGIVLFFVVLMSISCKNRKSISEKKSYQQKEIIVKKEWISIFNGKDLRGWTWKINGYPLGENFGNTFRVQKGLLSIRYDGYGPDLNNRFGTLYYNKRLSNYRLKVEYRFVGETAPGAPDWGYRDSGIQFHGQPPETQKLDQPFPICLEYNFHGGNGIDERPSGALCAYGMFVEVNGERNETTCIPATIARTFHGDQWVTAEIDVKNGQITHYVNGVEILHYANPTYDPKNETAQKLIEKGDSTVRGGYVSLQSNSHPMDFRKIELLEY